MQKVAISSLHINDETAQNQTFFTLVRNRVKVCHVDIEREGEFRRSLHSHLKTKFKNVSQCFRAFRTAEKKATLTPERKKKKTLERVTVFPYIEER